MSEVYLQAIISGVVRDDRGVRDVVIFHGEEKVFFRGGSEGGTGCESAASFRFCSSTISRRREISSR